MLVFVSQTRPVPAMLILNIQTAHTKRVYRNYYTRNAKSFFVRQGLWAHVHVPRYYSLAHPVTQAESLQVQGFICSAHNHPLILRKRFDAFLRRPPIPMVFLKLSSSFSSSLVTTNCGPRVFLIDV